MILPSGRIRSAVPNARLLAGHSLIDVPARDQLPGGRNFYWPTSLTTAVDPVSGKEVILLFLAQMFDPNLAADGRRDVAWTFAQVSSRLAAYSLAPDGRLTLLSLTRTPMRAFPSPAARPWRPGAFAPALAGPRSRVGLRSSSRTRAESRAPSPPVGTQSLASSRSSSRSSRSSGPGSYGVVRPCRPGRGSSTPHPSPRSPPSTRPICPIQPTRCRWAAVVSARSSVTAIWLPRHLPSGSGSSR